MDNLHGNNDGTFQCNYCVDTFLDAKYLEEHCSTRHLDYTPFVCCHHYCNVMFASESLLDLHCALKHNNKKKYHIVGFQFYDQYVDLKIKSKQQQSLLTTIPDLPQPNLSSNPVANIFGINLDKSTFWETCLLSKINVDRSRYLLQVYDFYRGAQEETKQCVKIIKCVEENNFRRVLKKRPFVKCKLCSNSFRNRNDCKYSHAVYHFCEKFKKSLFQCRICSTEIRYKSGLLGHMKKLHGLNDCKNGVDYVNRTETFAKEIDDIYQLAFRNEDCKVNLQKACKSAEILSSSFKQMASDEKCIVKFSKKIQRNQRFRCQICKLSLSGSGVNRHTLTHLNACCKINWLYKCKKCYLTTIHKDVIESHVVAQHAIEKSLVKPGVHYEDRRELHEKEIDQLRRLAFPEFPLYATEKVNQQKECNSSELLPPSFKQIASQEKCVLKFRKKIKVNQRHRCQICKYASFHSSVSRHSLTHLKAFCKIDWLFKCKKCSLTTMHKRHIDGHIVKKHKIGRSEVKPGVHYEDRRTLYKKEIEQLRNHAFPGLPTFTTEKDNQHKECKSAEKLSSSTKQNEKCGVKFSTQLKSNHRERCQICKTSCHYASVGKHTLTHMKACCKIDWLFKCKTCSLTTMYKDRIDGHIVEKHKIGRSDVKPSVHYEDLRALYKKEIEQLRSRAFPGRPLFTTEKINFMTKIKNKQCRLKKYRAVKKRVCQLCQIITSSPYQHTITHLKEFSTVDWLYKCNSCVYYSLRRCHVRSHLIFAHKINQNSIKSDVHYEDRAEFHKGEIQRVFSLAFPKSG